MQQVLPKDIIKKVRYIELKTRKAVESFLSGGYHSAFKGRGMEFSEVRPYVHGDDIRAIDWNVTARSGEPYVKVFQEERELLVMLLVDVSASLRFGSRYAFKSEIAAEIAAAISLSAISNNDNVGLMLFTGEVEKYIPPRKGKKHVLRVIREVLYHTPARTGTNIETALKHLNRVAKKRSLVFILSDFLDENWEKALSIASKRHDLIPVVFEDPLEGSFPASGLISLYDAEQNKTLLVDTSDKAFREHYFTTLKEKKQKRNSFFRSIDLNPVNIVSGESYIVPLQRYFKEREHRRVR